MLTIPSALRSPLLCLATAVALQAQCEVVAPRRLAPVTEPSTGMRREALVIGNSAYLQKPLQNPVNDATDMAAELAGLGFRVQRCLNLNRETLDSAVENWAKKLNPGDAALFFFAGHGLEASGENFLLPTDFSAQFESQVRHRALAANSVLGMLNERGVRASILILDACRDNPYRGWRRSNGPSGGLTNMDTGEGAYIAFAAAPGKVADDNTAGRNGLFTKHLLRALRQPGLSIDELFRQVREGVLGESPIGQRPYSQSGMAGEFYFRAASPMEAAVAPVAPVIAVPPQVDAAGLYRQGVVERDQKHYARALPLFQRAAEAGHRDAAYEVGELYYYGRGVDANHKEAVEWYRRAADSGDGRGMFDLGVLYANGRGGLAKDDAKAVEWYRRAADSGYGAGMTNLGVMYENGRGGLAKDDTKAAEWYRRAADSGNGAGMAYLGDMYENGRGVTKSRDEAIRLYRRAAALGDEFAQRALKRLGQ